MRRRLFFAAVPAVLALGFAPTAAQAASSSQNGTLQATITAGSIGSRTLAAVPLISLASSLTSNRVHGTYAVTVNEVAVTGFNGWSVTGALLGEQVALSTDATKTIPSDDFEVTAKAVTGVPAAGTDTPGADTPLAATNGGTQPFNGLHGGTTLWTNSTQSTSAVYTSVHAGTGDIAVIPPNGQVTGQYNGTLVVTLFQ